MPTKKLRLPSELAHSKLLEAIEKSPTPREWPEDEQYMEAAQPCVIAQKMIPQLHAHLVNARIGYLFRETMNKRDRLVLGKASKPGGGIAFLAGYDFLLTFNWQTWKDLDVGARCALVDHELAHLGRDGDAGKYFLCSHDLEEFGAIVRRWGLWRPDLVSFAQIVKVQLEIWGGADD